jgi:hypothetical protein
MVKELEPFYDIHGNERRCGSLILPDGFVCAFPSIEASGIDIWNAATRRKVLTDPGRIPARKTFGPKWVQNQRTKGSCNGYAEAGGYSKARYRRGIMDGKLFSGAFAYGLMNGGRDQGSQLQDGLKNLELVGIAEEQYADWDDIYPSLWKSGARENAALHKGIVCYAAETIDGLKTGLCKGFIAIVAVHAGNNFQRISKSGIAGIDYGPGNHAVHCDDLCIVGNREVFDMQNSWGIEYGAEGRAYLHEDSFAGTFKNHTFYLIGSTEEGGE